MSKLTFNGMVPVFGAAAAAKGTILVVNVLDVEVCELKIFNSSMAIFGEAELGALGAFSDSFRTEDSEKALQFLLQP